ncbi:hypothetical protein PFLUV_G00268280 [Perca fluviatilis]|uniref:Uncharacterized protein n=1 Tax=Perca fluviatilis TaxID=8168 RepID=A0A6A5DN38_PERFL|nr:hypothetical protein PFLUV_G00268280 [Perca fluviatilis]
MLLKVKCNSIKKYIKLHSGFTYSEFIREEFSPLDHSTPSSLTDTISLSSSDSDLRELGITTGRNRSSKEDMSSSATKASVSEAAKEMVEKALLKKPGGEDILEE